jgi:lycopene beta-cyclase
MIKTDVLILGAGCAGTSLAHHLESMGFGGEIRICDSRSAFNREQRWCTWADVPESMSHLVRRSWDRWSVVTDSEELVKTSASVRYSEIYAPDFFSHFHGRWKEGIGRTRLHLNETVTDVRSDSDGVTVTTNRGEWRAGLVFDARFRADARKPSSSEGLHQSFLGWNVEFPRAVFDPGKVVLMDFRLPAADGLNFIYILPYSDTKALVESTCFTETPIPWNQHIENVQDYLSSNFGDDYWIEAEESGSLPMTVRSATELNGDGRLFRIGAGGDGIRPSSGYAFHRIQRSTRAIAEMLCEKGVVVDIPTAADRYRLLDSVFLDVLRGNLGDAKKLFASMFKHVDADSLARFMLDSGSVADDLRVISSLPKSPFVSAVVRKVLSSVAGGFGRLGSYEDVDATVRNTMVGAVRNDSVRDFNR